MWIKVRDTNGCTQSNPQKNQPLPTTTHQPFYCFWFPLFYAPMGARELTARPFALCLYPFIIHLPSIALHNTNPWWNGCVDVFQAGRLSLSLQVTPKRLHQWESFSTAVCAVWSTMYACCISTVPGRSAGCRPCWRITSKAKGKEKRRKEKKMQQRDVLAEEAWQWRTLGSQTLALGCTLDLDLDLRH